MAFVWLAAATTTSVVEFSAARRTFSHRIDPDIDLERQKVIDDFVVAGRVVSTGCIARPEMPKSGRNATGGRIETDGSLAVLLLK